MCQHLLILPEEFIWYNDVPENGAGISATHGGMKGM